jgi:hypothetical protein
MNINQIRQQLEMLESNYGMAMDFEAYPLANHILKQIDTLRAELSRLITEDDPYTTEADVRYFEDRHDEQRAWYDTSAELY